MNDQEITKRIEVLERTVDILMNHLLDNYLILEDLMSRLGNEKMSLSPVVHGIEKNIKLLQQLQRLSKK